ncbi:MAG: hypothetical protein JW741_29140 [Sedimentisphaerales bacterium]|nr:hypothetical protein [Sedimentisphaerales bacterium]
MKRKRPPTYQTSLNGRPARVTVPEAVDEGDLFSAIRDNLSPQAVAAITAYLRSAQTRDDNVNRQVAWFTEGLINLLGVEQYGQLLEEVGL